MDSQQDLLFGALALRLDRISAEQFAEACILWSTRTDRPRLAELFVERGWMNPSECEEIEQQLGGLDGKSSHGLPVLDPGTRDGAPSLAGMELPGVRGGRYTIQEFRGEGGAGRVYIALDHVLNREVALKEVKPEMSRSSLARRRLLKEVQITGQLEHPSIVPVYDLARQSEGDTPFYTMRLLRGQLLQEAFADYHARLEARTVHPLELPRLLRAVISICNAISYAHSRGVIHRDLKPENVVLGRFGEVVLLDWGLAKLMAAASHEETESVGVTADARLEDTVAGLAVGTPAYMAPEQVAGGSGQVDVRTDVYGLGAILFELLTGRAPHFGEDSAEVLIRIASDATPRARDIAPSAPPALDAVCARAMAKDLEDRYATAQEVADDLERFLADEPVLAYPGGLAHRVGRWARRNRTWALAGAAALLITIAVTTTAAVRLGNMAAQEREAREHSLWIAAKFAAEKIANEIDLRWHYLQEEAADPALRAHVRAVGGWKDDLADYPGRSELEAWMADRHGKYSESARSTSWFLQDSTGRQLARSPPDPGILGNDFAYRDYFHGMGQDYPEGTRASPIREFYRSIVFKSAATDKPIVAFTTPVWDEEGRTGDVIGILGMTVELGYFGGLHTNLGPDHLAVLVETKNDWIEVDERTGLVLHHPVLTDVPEPQGVFRIRPGLVKNLRRLRELELGRRARWRMLSPEERLADSMEPLIGSLDPEYQDAVGGRYEGEWLAAFEPVLVNQGPDDFGDTGWIVIVQERRD